MALRKSSFNPRTHMGCDSARWSRHVCLSMFQSTHPHGVRLLSLRDSPLFSMFQSTHPHGVRLMPCLYVYTLTNVSIHAPTWGATEQFTTRAKFLLVSIHAPTWGATNVPSANYRTIPVSIHAPTWGATPLASVSDSVIWFQSTHPHGVRLHIQ